MNPKQKIRFQHNVDFEINDELVQTIDRIKQEQPELFKKTK